MLVPSAAPPELLCCSRSRWHLGRIRTKRAIQALQKLPVGMKAFKPTTLGSSQLPTAPHSIRKVVGTIINAAIYKGLAPAPAHKTIFTQAALLCSQIPSQKIWDIKYGKCGRNRVANQLRTLCTFWQPTVSGNLFPTVAHFRLRVRQNWNPILGTHNLLFSSFGEKWEGG